MQDEASGLEGRFLLVTAAPAEARAVIAAFGGADGDADEPWTLHRLSERADLLVTGIGKVNAAAAVAINADPTRHGAVLVVGVAGALPGSDLEPRAVAVASACSYADEGLQTDSEFRTAEDLGFPLGPFAGNVIPVPERMLVRLSPLADAVGPIATVSTCSGTDEAAKRVKARTGALAEAMEGAAVAHVVVKRFGASMPFGELRVISNRCGRRSDQSWDLPGALSRLTEVIGRLGLRDA